MIGALLKASIPLPLVAALAAAGGLAYYVQGERLESSQRSHAITRDELGKLRGEVLQQKADHATILAAETARVLEAERKLREAATEQGKKDEANKLTVSQLTIKLRNLGSSTGRLRDPYAETCRSGGGGSGTTGEAGAPAKDSGGNTAETSGLLSAGASQLLRQQTLEADEINIAYIACRARLMPQ